jgi:DNA-binding GntR family transcriptional regulator
MREDHERSVTAAARGRKREAYDCAVLMHGHIRAACNNRRLEQFMHILDDQIHQLGLVTLGVPGRLDRALAEHGAIIEAMERRDAQTAQSLMSAHLLADRNAALTRTTPADAPAFAIT